jgi:cytochrome c-type biogenesis protein CcmH/NrfG
MVNDQAPSENSAAGWQTKQVYVMAAVCLLVGLAVGYLFRGSQSPAGASRNGMPASVMGGMHPAGMGGQMPTLEQMKRMADQKAGPVLAKLKSDPDNADLLIQAGAIYQATHQFKEAADYYGKSLNVKPKNVAIRTEMASCLYYLGDVEGALHQLQQATTDDPKDANSLFNLGFIRWREKKDSKGALAAWQQLLKTNPQLEAGKKAEVEKLIADARRQGTAN